MSKSTEAMNGLLQQTKTAVRGFRTVSNFVAIAYLRMGKLTHLPKNPVLPVVPRGTGETGIGTDVKFHWKRHGIVFL